MKTSKLTLVGAGPGDKDLITFKGIKVLQRANVILYDALVNPEILDFAKPDSIKIPVGKRGGKKSVSQERINQLIISHALIHGEVVRLKGGDPFIFGRGYEEVAFAEKNGIEVEVVPGISSATGLSALNKISLTQRGIADGFWVLTASKIGDEFNAEITLAAQSNSTVVILMGVRKLKQIIHEFEQFGRQNTPVMLIQNGSLDSEKVIRGTVSDILNKAESANFASPGIIIIGETLNYKSQQEIMKNTAVYLN